MWIVTVTDETIPAVVACQKPVAFLSRADLRQEIVDVCHAGIE
jgi:hypothetical protein